MPVRQAVICFECWSNWQAMPAHVSMTKWWRGSRRSSWWLTPKCLLILLCFCLNQPYSLTRHVVLFKNKHTCWLTSAGFVCGLGRLSLRTSCIFHLRNPLESHITSICLTWFVWKYPEIKVWIKGNSWPFRFFPLSLYENDWNPFTLLVRLNLYKSMSFILEDCQD